MRIGINANYFLKPSTGIGVVTLEFMRALATDPVGQEHEWIWYYEGAIPAGDWPQSWRFERVNCWWRRDDVPHRYFWERFSLPRRVRSDRCDVFFSLYQSATILDGSVRHVMLVHDLVPKRFPEYLRTWRQRFHFRAIEQAIARAHTIIVPSAATAEDLETLLSVAKPKITVAPLGVPSVFSAPLSSQEVQAVLARHEIAPGYIYHGGGLELRKNTALLLRAYAELVRSEPAGNIPPLVISGTIHPAANSLATPVRALIRELSIEDRVQLVGWVPDAELPAFYRGAAVFVYPSRYEGFGLPILEAFVSGVPVITTRAGSLAELGQDAVIVVNPDDVTALARALHQALSDETLRLTLRAKGHERAMAYSWEKFVSTITARLLQ